MADLQEIFDGVEPTQPVETEASKPEALEDGEALPAEGQEHESKTVPLAALQQEREKGKKRYTEQVADFERRQSESDMRWNQRFEQLVAALKPQQAKEAPQPLPEFNWENPLTTVDSRVDSRVGDAERKIQETMSRQSEQFHSASMHNARLIASSVHGADVVKEAEELFNRMAHDGTIDKGEWQKINGSPNPFAAAVDWHKQKQLLSEVGPDPEAYKAKIIADYLASQDGGKEPATQTPAPVMPSNFANARNVGSRSGPAWAGPASLADVFDRS